MRQNQELIINFVPTGMVPQKADSPHVPISPVEILDDVDRAAEIGISMVHLHAREQDGTPSSRAEIYEEIMTGIRSRHPELVVCLSASGRTVQDFASRSQPLDLEGHLKPDLGSLTLGSLNFPKAASVNDPDMIRRLAEKMQTLGIIPEIEIFDLGMINYLHYLIRNRLIEAPYYANIILGNITGAQADLVSAGLLIRELPPDTLWSLGGIGSAQLKANALGIVAGGGVRVGLEDNLFWDESRTQKTTNTALLTRIHSLADSLGRNVMSSASLRQHLQLKPGFGEYGRAKTNV